MAMTLSTPASERPFELPGVMLGDAQFAEHERWGDAGLLALVGIGVEPGLSDVFARHAADELFSEIDEVGIRDGADLVVEGYDFAPTFSIWTTIEECLNPPLIWERERGWFTTEPFSEPEVFDFPEGIGPIECVNVEHEEVVLVPRWVDCRRVTFKYGLGDEFIGILQDAAQARARLEGAGHVRGVEVAPRDVLAAALPDPATLGDRMTGKTCAGTFVTGHRQGRAAAARPTSTTSPTTSGRCASTARRPSSGRPRSTRSSRSSCSRAATWKGTGVLGPEAFPRRAVPRPARRLRRADRHQER